MANHTAHKVSSGKIKSDLMDMTYAELQTSLQTDLQPLGLNGTPVSNAQPADGAVLTWSQAQGAWVPGSVVAYTTLPYASGWGNWGSPYALAGYTKDGSAFVSLRGAVKNAATFAAGALIATLPAGFRPKAQQLFPCTYADASSTWSSLMVSVEANGNVTAFKPTAGSSAGSANSFLDLSPIRFSTN